MMRWIVGFLLAALFVAAAAHAQQGNVIGPLSPCSAFGTASGQCAQGGVITAAGPAGSATVAPIITYNAAGQLTAVSSATITPAVGSITGLGANVTTALGQSLNGSGAISASTSPVFVTPALGAATATSLAATGIISTSNAGTAANPEITVGNATTGLYSVSTTGLGFSVNGVSQGDWGIGVSGIWSFGGGIVTSSGGSISWSGRARLSSPISGSIELLTTGSANPVFLSNPATATWQLGQLDAASPIAQTLQVQSVAAGNANTAGSPFTIQGSLSNGSGVGGDIAIKTSLATAASGSQNTAVNALLLKAGTQHHSFGGSGPVVSACGTGSPSIDANSTDSSGTVTTGTVATTCTVTFAKAYTSFNHCRVTSQSAISGLAYSYTLSAIIVTASVLGGDSFDFDCDGT